MSEPGGADSVVAAPFRAARRVGLGGLALAALVLTAVFAVPSSHADSIRDDEYWLKSANIEKAWGISQGEGVKVAVIDTGIAKNIKELDGAVAGGADASGSGAPDGQEPLGSSDEEKQHGTMVASLLAGRGKSNSPKASADATPSPKASMVGNGPDGVIGVAPKAELLSMSVWVGGGNPSGASIEEQIPKAVMAAVDQGAKVINMSLGSNQTSWPQSWDEAFSYAQAHDVVIVAAAGNRDSGITQVGAPATIPGVVAVGGLQKDGKASQGASSQGISISVSAPAEQLLGVTPNDVTTRWQGTSGAAPLVSGTVALIRSAHPEMNAAQVIEQLICGTTDGVGCKAPQPDPLYGYGKLDAYKALTVKTDPVTANPLGSIDEWIHIHRRADSTSTPMPSQTFGSPNPAPTEAFADPEPPQAQAPTDLNGTLPAIIVLGFAGLALLILLGGGAHLVFLARLRRKKAAKAVDTSES